jgi:hypothetical protein
MGFDLNLIESDKYVNVFGYGDAESIDNSKINEMFDTIEKLYDNKSKNGTMPDIWQIMVYSKDCPHCQNSLPIWEKLAEGLEKRLRKYHHAEIELGDDIEIDGQRITGADLYRTFNSKRIKDVERTIKDVQRTSGVPFFLQNFKIDEIRTRTVIMKSIVETEFHVISVGELAPFSFLATAFEIPNKYIESKIHK